VGRVSVGLVIGSLGSSWLLMSNVLKVVSLLVWVWLDV